jgi:(p)ppGpp synthase/HD superfamily hydrolase
MLCINKYEVDVQMRRKGVGVDQIYDARALRVVVGDADGKLHVAAVEGCYNLLSVIHRYIEDFNLLVLLPF